VRSFVIRYQEMLLSRRRLVFVDSQMVFQCCKQYFQEACSLPSAIFTRQDPDDTKRHALSDAQLGCTSAIFGLSRPQSPFPEPIIGDFGKEIYDRIGSYSWKILSYSEDILNAFSGIFDAFNRSATDYTHHFWGIPILTYQGYAIQTSLDSAVCSILYGLSWKPHARRLKRRPGQWPSWSWTSVIGGVKYGEIISEHCGSDFCTAPEKRKRSGSTHSSNTTFWSMTPP
jgi:hypothetical protein